MNPAELLKLKSDLKAFEKEHPKFLSFLRYCADRGMGEGTVVDVTLRYPDGTDTHANMRLTEQDAQTLQRLRKVLLPED